MKKTALSKRFCMLPWTSIHTRPDGRALPCCVAMQNLPVGSLLDESIEEIWNGERMRALRKRMMNDEESPECVLCYELEGAGSPSIRQGANERFENHMSLVEETRKDGSVEKVNLRYLDIRFSNVCNFRCRTCGPSLSSGWYDDAETLVGKRPYGGKVVRPFEDPQAFFRQLEPFLPDLEEIYFAGGEPLVSDEHYHVLEFLAQKKLFHVRIYYNTNFSKVKHRGHDIFRLWRPFENLLIGASLDGMGARGEYLRKGQIWSEIENNRREMMRECPTARFQIAFTLSAMNSLHLPDFHRNWVEQGLIGMNDLVINLLQEPHAYRIQILPPELKRAVRKKYEKHIAEFVKEEKIREAFIQAIQFMEQEDMSSLLPEFRIATQKLDAIRNERFGDVFPELESLMNS